MKITIITVAYNAAATIRDTIESVASQSYPHIEYIVVDGASTDGTGQILSENADRIDVCLSEPDEGLYDAMNKGIALATGDYIGILNADDIYVDEGVISRVVDVLENDQTDVVFADLVYVRSDDMSKVVRRYSSKGFHPSKFAYGWMPAHPTCFIKRSCYERYGLYKTDYAIAADYELLIRMLYVNKVSYSYIPEVLIKMRLGGLSTVSLRSNIVLNNEILRGCLENGIKTNYIKIYSKYFKKLLELVKR
jgi:glycosyltransferase involved in cell wall biosynthesis